MGKGTFGSRLSRVEREGLLGERSGDEVVAAMAGLLILANNCATPSPFFTLRYQKPHLARRPNSASHKPKRSRGVRASKRDGDEKKISFGDRLLDYIEGTPLLGAFEFLSFQKMKY